MTHSGLFGEDSSKKYWYNTRTGQVEYGPMSLAMDRLGPFSTAEEASRAPEVVAERARIWAQEDQEWDR